MILALDIGNTNIVFGLFKGKKLVSEWRFPTDNYRIPAVKSKIDLCVVASVVPFLNKQITNKIKKQFKCKVHFVTADNIAGIMVKPKNKKEIGADRIVDALAAYQLYGGPTIIVDFGTATTFDVVSKNGAYLGGAIAPGITLARDALYEQTAKLPRINIVAPKKIIGDNTVLAMQSGLVYGYVAMVEGMVQRLKSQLQTKKIKINPKSKIQTIATGGFAKLICKYTKVVDRIDQKLTLKGLNLIAIHQVER